MAANAGALNSISSLTYPRKTFSLIAICFVFSGAAGLIYEVLWARMLGLVFGATSLAISAVLAAFMGGLALGSALAAKFAPRIRRPVRAYAMLEIAVGVYALAVPMLFRGIDSVYAIVWQHLQLGPYGFALSRFVLAAIVLVVPTALMGATLPVLSVAVTGSIFDTSRVARLYTCNLAGAIAGTIGAGFFLMPSLGMRMTIWIAAATNLAIGLVAFLIDRKVGAMGPTNFSLSRTSEQANEPTGGQTEVHPTFWLFCAFISGFVTISMQVIWSRVLTMIIGSSTYAFSIVLALFLFGLALGAYFVSRSKSRNERALRRRICTLEILTAASLFLSIRAASATPDLLIAAGFRFGIHSWIGLLALQIAAATLLVLLPAILMGTIMPFVLVWAENLEPKETAASLGISLHPRVRFIGQSYALNTIGAIIGSILTAFILIPKTTTRVTSFFAASLCVVVAAIAWEPRRVTSDRALASSLATGAAATLILAMFFLWPRLNLDALSVGAYDSLVRVLAKSRSEVPAEQSEGPEQHQLLMYEEGRTATVSVRRDWGITSVAINGRTNASDGEDMPTQIMLGQLGILAAPRLDKALIVGFATGVTAGSVLQSPVESVDCVEIERAAVSSSRYFDHVNHQPLTDPRLRVIIDDARTYLRVKPGAYDLIVSEPSHPWVPGVANLFTREFFTLGRDRLKDDGVFVQWLQIYQLSTESLRSVLATFHEVFPHVLVFQMQGAAKGKDLILLGSRTPLSFDRLTQRFNEPRTSAELARAGIKTPEDLRDWFVCDETQLAPAVVGAVINTDDNMHVETVAPREAFRPTMEENIAWIQGLRRVGREF